MRYITLGSIVVLLSPLLDFLLRRYVPVPVDVYASLMVRTGLQTLVIIPLVSGMILYLVGYKKREVNLQEAKVTFILGIPLHACNQPLIDYDKCIFKIFRKGTHSYKAPNNSAMATVIMPAANVWMPYNTMFSLAILPR
jgi:hypothetical protein